MPSRDLGRALQELASPVLIDANYAAAPSNETSMKILAHIHTFNDEDVIDLSIRSIMNQTHPVDEIIIVDNASTDHTLERRFPDKVKIIRHTQNLGTSGSVNTGMRHALEYHFDWIWICDADSAPRPDALEKLMAFYSNLSTEKQERVQSLFSLPVDVSNSEQYHGMVFTANGYEIVNPDPNVNAYQCDSTIWSGSLFKVEAIRQIGLPSLDYVLDWGENEYGYQGMKRGYKTYVVQFSLMDHNIDRNPTAWLYSSIRWGPLSFKVMNLSAIRLYYIIRNNIYFWIYEYEQRTCRLYLHIFKGWIWIPKHIVKLFLLQRWTELRACLRGIWDGIMKNMHHRY